MSSTKVLSVGTIALSLLALAPPAPSQSQSAPTVFTPGSSLSQPGAPGNPMAQTNVQLMVPGGAAMTFGQIAANPFELPPFAGFLFETPASIACLYNLAAVHPGCNPNVTTANPTGGNRAIAIVDAFDDATAVSDLATFSAQFGLPPADLTVVFANGTRPGIDHTGGFEIEESVGIEWAHAMAPAAKIFLVETANNSFANLFNGVVVASNLVAAAGGGEVVMTFGAPEEEVNAAFETASDPTFTTAGVVYFASAGDSPGTVYPSTSPNVVSVGGTSISRNPQTGNLILETAWQNTGGGPSLFEPRPAFQNNVEYIVGNARGTPDISAEGNPNSGVWVFDSNPILGTGWFVAGGTSVAAPIVAGIVNAAGTFSASSQAENQILYRNSFNPTEFHDILYGNCGLNIGTFAILGYDMCSGVGSPAGLKGK